MQYKINPEIVELLHEKVTTPLEAYLYLTTLEEPTSLLALSREFGWDKSKVARFLKRLDDAGVIRCEQDRRGTTIEFTNDAPKKNSTRSLVKIEGQVQLLDQQWYDAATLTKTQKNEAALVIRRKKFREEMKQYIQQYPECIEELQKFYLWATEPNKSRTKMKMETYPTWDTSRRISNWLNSHKNGTRYSNSRATQHEQDSKRRDASIAVDIETIGSEAAAQRRAELAAQGII